MTPKPKPAKKGPPPRITLYWSALPNVESLFWEHDPHYKTTKHEYRLVPPPRARARKKAGARR